MNLHLFKIYQSLWTMVKYIIYKISIMIIGSEQSTLVQVLKCEHMIGVLSFYELSHLIEKLVPPTTHWWLSLFNINGQLTLLLSRSYDKLKQSAYQSVVGNLQLSCLTV